MRESEQESRARISCENLMPSADEYTCVYIWQHAPYRMIYDILPCIATCFLQHLPSHQATIALKHHYFDLGIIEVNRPWLPLRNKLPLDKTGDGSSLPWSKMDIFDHLRGRQELFRLFSDAFTHLPLCTLVNDSVFVVHGGLSSKAQKNAVMQFQGKK